MFWSRMICFVYMIYGSATFGNWLLCSLTMPVCSTLKAMYIRQEIVLLIVKQSCPATVHPKYLLPTTVIFTSLRSTSLCLQTTGKCTFYLISLYAWTGSSIAHLLKSEQILPSLTKPYWFHFITLPSHLGMWIFDLTSIPPSIKLLEWRPHYVRVAMWVLSM